MSSGPLAVSDWAKPGLLYRTCLGKLLWLASLPLPTSWRDPEDLPTRPPPPAPLQMHGRVTRGRAPPKTQFPMKLCSPAWADRDSKLMPTKGHRDISVPITLQKLIKKLPLYPALQLGAETTLALSFADWQRTGSNAL